MQMRVTIAENEKKLFREESSSREHDCAEKKNAAGDEQVKITQFRFALTARERGNENVREHVHEDGKDHCQAAERADLGDRAGLMREKADQKNRDLSLEAIKQRIRGELFD